MNLNLSNATRIGLNLLALLGVIVALRLGESIFVPLVIAVLLSVILWPAARWLHYRAQFPWFLSCLTVVMGLVAANLALFIGFAVAIPKMFQDLPNPNNIEQQYELYQKFRKQVASISPGSIDEVMPENPENSSFFQYVRKTLTGEYVTNKLLDLARYGTSWLWQSVLILFILLFLLLEGEMLGQRVKEIFGTGLQTQRQVTGALAQMADSIRAYLVWRTIVNMGLGLCLGVFYHLIGLKYAFVWGLLTAVLSYIPYLGTIIAGIPPILDGFVHTSPVIALVILIVYTAVVTFEGYIIVPVVMGRSMDMNATTVMLACLFWDLVWGTPGLFLAMPLMAGVKAVCLHVEGWRPWANLMSTSRGYALAEAERLAALGKAAREPDATILMEEPAGRRD